MEMTICYDWKVRVKGSSDEISGYGSVTIDRGDSDAKIRETIELDARVAILDALEITVESQWHD